MSFQVRDSVYCAAAIWSLYQAYRRIDDDRGKSHELGQSAVKCMRGILECWIKQADRVELFKQRQCTAHALHVKFHIHTGEIIYSDEAYNHLQIDVISIYLIFLVQMITSGENRPVSCLKSLFQWLLRRITNHFHARRGGVRTKSRVLRRTCVSYARLWYVGAWHEI